MKQLLQERLAQVEAAILAVSTAHCSGSAEQLLLTRPTPGDPARCHVGRVDDSQGCERSGHHSPGPQKSPRQEVHGYVPSDDGDGK